MCRIGLATFVLLACLASPARADLRFPEPAANVGEVRSGVPLAHAFAFVNDGPDPVEVTEARPGCGCLRPRLGQRHFAPGEHGVLPLEVNSLGQAAGPHTWHLTVFYRAGDQQREQALRVTANVVTEVSVQPAALTLFAEGALSHAVTLTDLRPQPLVVVRVESTSPHLHVRATPPARDAFGHWTARITVEVAADCPPGRHEELIAIHTSDPLYREIKIPVTLTRAMPKRLSAAPPEVALTGTPRFVRIRDRDNQPVVIATVTADHPAIQCQASSGSDGVGMVRIQVDRAQLDGDRLRGTVTVEVSAPVRERLVVPVTFGQD